MPTLIHPLEPTCKSMRITSHEKEEQGRLQKGFRVFFRRNQALLEIDARTRYLLIGPRLKKVDIFPGKDMGQRCQPLERVLCNVQ